MQLPSANAITTTGATLTTFEITSEQLEQRAKWAERIGIGPMIAIISLSIITAVLCACLLGFRLVAMEFIKPTFDDQRAAIRETSSSVQLAATAIQTMRSHDESQTKAMESQTRALWDLKRNSDENLSLHRSLLEILSERLGRPTKPEKEESE